MVARPLRIVSWNVNGLRAAEKKGFSQWLRDTKADVVGIQEVRAGLDQIPPTLREPSSHLAHFVPAQRKGYSGVGMWVRRRSAALPVPRFERLLLDHEKSSSTESLDDEGRLQVLHWGDLKVVNGYFPNGDGKNRDNSRVPFKLRFYSRLREVLHRDMKSGRPLLVMGDWNTAHRPIDLARPQQNKKTSGFLPEECAAFDRWIEDGWIDTFRHFHPVPDPFAVPKRNGTILPEGGGHYTWWSQRFGVREKNIGWRIDYVLASPGAFPFLRRANIHPEVRGSDHCPVSVTVDPSILG